MSLVNDLLEKPTNLTIASRYTAMNGVLYLGTGALLIAWPEAVQIISEMRPSLGARNR